jgi:peptide/nickel transport system ATP-binding protein
LPGEDLRKAWQERLRSLRGDRIAMIFQDPLMTLNPVLSIGEQMSEAILEHRQRSRKDALNEAAKALAQVGFPRPRLGSSNFRTNSRAACASASRSRLRC